MRGARSMWPPLRLFAPLSLLILLFLFSGEAAALRTIFASLEGHDTPSCGSFNEPCGSLRYSIAFFNGETSGGELILMPGTYRGPNNTELAFPPVPLTIRAYSSPVVLDCQKSCENSLFTFSTTDAAPVAYTVQGLSFINAPSQRIVNGGGAIQAQGPLDLTIDGCNFTSCGSVPLLKGGAVYGLKLASLRITGSGFFANMATQGGAVTTDQVARVEIADTKFLENQASVVDGGAVLLMNPDEFLLRRCRFEGNYAQKAVGGLSVWEGDNGRVEDSLFTKNFAQEGDVGAILIGLWAACGLPGIITGLLGPQVACRWTALSQSGIDIGLHREHGRVGGGPRDLFSTRVTVTGCLFEGNHVDMKGGGMLVDSSTDVAIAGCRFAHNKATLVGGGLHLDGSSHVSLAQSAFLHNEAEEGGALRIAACQDLNLTQLNLTANVAGSGGGACLIRLTDLALHECAFEGNLGYEDGGALWIVAGEGYNITRNRFLRNKSIAGGAVYVQLSGQPLRGQPGRHGRGHHLLRGSRLAVSNATFIAITSATGRSSTGRTSPLSGQRSGYSGGAIFVFGSETRCLHRAWFLSNQASGAVRQPADPVTAPARP
ncbi:hypothetical protein PAPYR_3208 [Paratrimastix pyriformis]|uniref:Right handed beta helix domain-containing protein n=1 Tax=Paratrimastix pyriformis TaxID=342808 RepID=A0ABQ8UN16_9EUKA|nr:hypothetical protein PAPYR_3208 [Paratrimastix pyriformis]